MKLSGSVLAFSQRIGVITPATLRAFMLCRHQSHRQTLAVVAVCASLMVRIESPVN
jgi:hypothetical protein